VGAAVPQTDRSARVAGARLDTPGVDAQTGSRRQKLVIPSEVEGPHLLAPKILVPRSSHLGSDARLDHSLFAAPALLLAI
jgi:hypothetical protein